MEQNKFDQNETMEMEQSGGIQKFDFWAKAVARCHRSGKTSSNTGIRFMIANWKRVTLDQVINLINFIYRSSFGIHHVHIQQSLS